MASVDEVFDLLNSERLRYALYYLDDQDSPVSVDRSAEEVAEMEIEGRSSNVPDEKVKNLEVAFKYKHFPEMEDVDFLEYDSAVEEVRLLSKPSKFDAILTISKVIEEVN